MELFLLAMLILLNAFFAASEIALISLNDNRIKVLAEEGDRKAQLLQKLLSEPSRFLATIQIGITFAGFLASAFAADTFAKQLTLFLIETGVPLSEMLLRTASVIFITLILSYFTLVLGELVPKRLAMKKAEAIAMAAIRPLTVLAAVSSPFVKLLTISTNVLVRLFGVDPNAIDDDVTEEEIRLMVDVGEERGAIQEDEKMMINNIFDFDTKIVSDIMTHRIHVVGIAAGSSFRDVIRTVNDERYTRFPVYEGVIDNVVGILHVKDLVQYMEGCDESTFDLTTVIREPFFVPSSKRIDDLFEELQKHKVHLAIAIDEYGGTAGIVTIEDVLEEIVGSIQDEYDEEEKEIVELEEGGYLIQGDVLIEDVEELLQVKLPESDYETLSGFLIGQLGRIPGSGEQFGAELEGYRFEIEQVGRKRIASIRVTKAGQEDEEGGKSGDSS